VRVLADDFVNTRNVHMDNEPATEYHGKLVSLAAGKAVTHGE